MVPIHFTMALKSSLNLYISSKSINFSINKENVSSPVKGLWLVSTMVFKWFDGMGMESKVNILIF